MTASSWQEDHEQKGELHRLLRELVVAATHLADAVEQLKTDGAVYRNSVRFLPAAVSRLGQNSHGVNDDLRQAAHRVLGQILAFSLDGGYRESTGAIDADLKKNRRSRDSFA